MNWEHVQLIFKREMRDQLRDRRTLFTIAVLPLLLYPLMGMLMLQITQFHREHPVRVAIVGNEFWPENQPLLRDGKLLPEWLESDEHRLVQVESQSWPSDGSREATIQGAKARVLANEVDLFVLIDPKIGTLLDEWKGNRKEQGDLQKPKASEGALLTIVNNRASDRSNIADRRMREVIEKWQRHWVRQKLEESSLANLSFNRLESPTWT